MRGSTLLILSWLESWEGSEGDEAGEQTRPAWRLTQAELRRHVGMAWKER
jgi:hypothetical protein